MAPEDISNEVAIATSTLYDLKSESDMIRLNLAKKLIKKAVGSGYEIIVVDRSSEKDIVSDFFKLGARVYKQSEKGMGKGRREVMRYAYKTGRKALMWIEPEKESLVGEIPKLVKPILEDKAEIVVPKRKSLKSYPVVQQYSEPLGNLLFKQLTGRDLDIYSGPKVFSRGCVNYFLDYNGEYGDLWDCIQIPIMNAVFDGKRVLSVEVDYTHPKEQTEIEEGNLDFYKKRIEQLVNQMDSLSTHWRKLISK